MNIICILGYTAAGKDTVTNKIAEEYEDIKKIVPITTRPARENELNGIDYFFYTEDYFNEESENLIAKRHFTVWNGETWNYAFDKRLFSDCNNCIMSTDIGGYMELKEEFPDANIIGIFLDVPISVLIKRLEERKTPEDEINRRLLDDIKRYEDFKYNHNDKLYVVRNISKNSIRKIINIIDYENKESKKGLFNGVK